MLGPVTSHSRAGRKPSAPASPAPSAPPPSRQSFSMNWPPSSEPRSACSTTGWRPPTISKAVLVVEDGPRIVLARRHLGEARLAVELGQRARHLAQGALLRGHCGGQLGEDLLLQRQRPVGGGDDAALGLHQLLSGEPHGAGHGLAMAEDIAERRRLQRLGGAGGGLDVVAQDIVVAHLERLDAGLGHIAGLQRRHHLAAVVAHHTGRVEVG